MVFFVAHRKVGKYREKKRENAEVDAADTSWVAELEAVKEW